MKIVNGMTVYEGTDKCALDEYSEKVAEEVSGLLKPIKNDISNIKEEQTNQNEKIQQNSDNITEQNKNIEELKQENEKLKNNLINVKTEQASNINIQDCSDLEGSIDVEGNSVQEGEPTPEAPIAIQNVEGNIDITVCNKNLFDKTKSKINYILTATGTEIVSEGAFISDYIFVKKGITYFSNTRGYSNAGFYDLDKQFIERKDLPQNSQFIPDNNYYIRLNGKIENIETLQFEIDNKSTEYTQHQQQTITFPLSEGQKLMKGDYLADDGIHHKRKQFEVDGTNLRVRDIFEYTNGLYYCTVTIPFISINKSDGYSTHFKWLKQGIVQINCCYVTAGGSTVVLVLENQNITTVEDANNWLIQQKQAGTPVKFECELAEEEIEPYTSEQQEEYNKLQKVLPYKLVTNIFTDLALLRFNYIADTKTYIDNKFNNLAQQFLNL